MTGSDAMMVELLEGSNKRFVIPVYQRHYDWKYSECRKLYKDLKAAIEKDKPTHFFGNITMQVIGVGPITEYHIVDGQQRITTISLLLLAMRNLIKAKQVTVEEDDLDEQINDRFLASRYAKPGKKIKLRPRKGDKEDYDKLFGPVEDYNEASNLTQNYKFFWDILLKEEMSIDVLFEGLSKLQIMCLTLDDYDNAQEIFESLNSTGRTLTEGDKIRNYVLMGLPVKDQEELYGNYWEKIENLVGTDVSPFIRDYISVKKQTTPTISNVYQGFREYVEEEGMAITVLLEDLLKYARLYSKLVNRHDGVEIIRLNDCLNRLKRLDLAVTRPFLMEIMRYWHEGKLNNDEVLTVFLTIESYLFRRNICDVPTNALNKIFVNLNKEILRYDGTMSNYLGKFLYALTIKRESGRFPNDEEFEASLTNKQVYNMRGRYKDYLFERMENYGIVETKDVYTHLDNGTYSIEHIMPQHLTQAWIDDLGEDYEDIHATWLHRLANLTLTGYNSEMSNSSFTEKRDGKDGYRKSGLRMNQMIATKEKWGLAELEERNTEMLAKAKEIWPYPETDFKPAEREYDFCTLDDEDTNLTGRDIVKYSYQGVDQPVATWSDMYERVIRLLHQTDKSVLTMLAYSKSDTTELSSYVQTSPNDLRVSTKIDENIYIEMNTSTAMKISLMRKIFALYGVDPMDLVFYLRDDDSDRKAESARHEIRRRYWSYALPLIKAQNQHRGTFGNVGVNTYNAVTGNFGISGFYICCVANMDSTRVEFVLAKGDSAKNKETFDLLFSHKEEIEETLGAPLEWDRADNKKSSWMLMRLPNTSITDEADWPRMARFHAEWSDKILNAVLPYLWDDGRGRAGIISSLIRVWAAGKDSISLNLSKCNTTYTRFTTPYMSVLFPDIEEGLSDWKTPNHYFYEIVHRGKGELDIQLCFNSKNATEGFLKTVQMVEQYYPSRMKKTEWQWKTLFKTKKISESEDQTSLSAALDGCLDEVFSFEADLREKLNNGEPK